MAIYEFEGKTPVIGKHTFIHREATIIGNVKIGEGCYIGAGARLRGDWGAVEIGSGSNIQENCVIHTEADEVARLGLRCHIGHGAILHGPILKEHVTVGMGAIIMDGAVIGKGSLIAAGCVIPPKTEISDFKLVMGVPGKVVDDISQELRDRLLRGTNMYLGLVVRCQDSLREIPYE